MQRNSDQIRLGVIGCGAIAESHVMAFKKKENIRFSVAVDRNLETARQFAQAHGFERHVGDYKDAFELADAVVVCAPNFLHAAVSIDFLSKGINVLCEKPMAIKPKDAERMVAEAKKSGAVLGIANIRRQYWSSREIKRVISEGSLGRLLSVDLEEGNIFSWPTKSGFFFDWEKSGGGVLMDIGSHAIDLLLWWCGESFGHISYTDDNHGGVEADAEMTVDLAGAAKCSIALSRLRTLRNTCELKFEKGSLRFSPYEFNAVAMAREGGSFTTIASKHPLPFEGYFSSMIDDFVSSIREGTAPFVDPGSVVPSIKFIDECYANPSRFSFPWL